jgi:hypothetical protein
MTTVSFKEYEDAKLEIIHGVEFHEDSIFPNQYGMLSKTYCTKENGTFYEVTDPNTGITEFWSDKHSISRYYDGRTRETIIAQYEEKIATIAKENEALKSRVKALRTPTGTNMTQERYTELEKRGITDELTDDEAIALINQEFGFEAERIDILHEAEIDVTEEGSRQVKIKKIPRKPLYASTDWNYIRFNVRTAPAIWQYEMINADLEVVLS